MTVTQATEATSLLSRVEGADLLDDLEAQRLLGKKTTAASWQLPSPSTMSRGGAFPLSPPATSPKAGSGGVASEGGWRRWPVSEVDAANGAWLQFLVPGSYTALVFGVAGVLALALAVWLVSMLQ
mmetsp:Transcript_2906/g.8275  ORF Transcript_2906/g.8275 Transcript_2906/m.8275 type:complete len:125 (-) Transcript_2906:134-508(-)|eukprot:CAMPEP_0118998302 /NCGR_PEP_ID=MMETSP1173-20130426/63006_1 /TAXON_ID=1034831 /ORGANISM="Rhizochromulina marina cf, Strain CCMP1243" /LENGTH=124 /DNA_ID=CAMNT_0006949793 /DNA_START=129 /DNA_END=503 /DNA_ORIENTATION=+